MDLTKYRQKLIGNEQERAVSPVIGVILMVAITVILAAVIAAFVLDMGDMGSSAPNAQYEWETIDTANDTVEVTLTSGEEIDTGTLSVSNGAVTSSNPDISAEGDTWSAGQSVTITVNDPSEAVQIIWESDGTSSILTDYEI